MANTKSRSAGREHLLDRLAKDYRKVLRGEMNEKAFGAKLEQYEVGQGEMALISRMARKGGQSVEYTL